MQREITQEDLDANPILAELGAVIGSVVAVATNTEVEVEAPAPVAPETAETEATPEAPEQVEAEVVSQ